MTTPQQETTLPNDEPEVSRPDEYDPYVEGEDTEELDFDWEAEDTSLDPESLYDDRTDQETEQGRLMGERIDTNDDEDAG